MTAYYQMKKHLIRERYYDKKRQEAENKSLFCIYGGEKEYYKKKMIEWGVVSRPIFYCPPEPVVAAPDVLDAGGACRFAAGTGAEATLAPVVAD